MKANRLDVNDGEAGTYIVEVALVMPIFLMLIFGFISAAMLLFVYCEVTYAAQTAVRYASLHSTDTPSNTQSTINTLVASRVLFTNGGVLQNPSWDGTTSIGANTSVTVQVNFPASLPYIPLSSILLSSKASSPVLH